MWKRKSIISITPDGVPRDTGPLPLINNKNPGVENTEVPVPTSTAPHLDSECGERTHTTDMKFILNDQQHHLYNVMWKKRNAISDETII